MAKHIEANDLPVTHEHEFDAELVGDIENGEPSFENHQRSARREIECRAESRWLRDQLTDWDDWDEYFDIH
jgi:hypothetical protein